MSQFEIGHAKKPKMALTAMTTFANLADYNDHNNLQFSGRIGWVQKDVVTKPGKKGIFSVVLINVDGIADLNVWDVDTHALWKRAIGCMVEIEGLTCSNRQPGNEDWARAPGDVILHANKGRYTIKVIKGMDNPHIPMNGCVPDLWLRSKSSQSQQGSAPPTPSRAIQGTAAPHTAKRCCDAPEGISCRATGNPHVSIAVCAICHLPIDPKQPFCGEQVGGLLCEALLRAPPTASPFTTVDTSTARRPREPTPPTEGDRPASKVLKF